MVKKILRLGDPMLYRPSVQVAPDELPALRGLAEDLGDTLIDYQRRHGYGSMLTAPQIGVHKRMFFINIDGHPTYIINPMLLYPSSETCEVIESCFSYPQLKVKIRRHRQCVLRYYGMDWQTHEVILQEEMARLVQHAVDHLDGILGVQRAVDDRSLFLSVE